MPVDDGRCRSPVRQAGKELRLRGSRHSWPRSSFVSRWCRFLPSLDERSDAWWSLDQLDVNPEQLDGLTLSCSISVYHKDWAVLVAFWLCWHVVRKRIQRELTRKVERLPAAISRLLCCIRD